MVSRDASVIMIIIPIENKSLSIFWLPYVASSLWLPLLPYTKNKVLCRYFM